MHVGDEYPVCAREQLIGGEEVNCQSFWTVYWNGEKRGAIPWLTLLSFQLMSWVMWNREVLGSKVITS